MEKVAVVHYVIDTYGDKSNYRHVNMSEVIDRYEMVTERIKNALVANGVEDPDNLISYSFRMLGEHGDTGFNRKELVDINLDVLKEDLVGFPWENWAWVESFQPVIDVIGYSIVELESEFKSFGPSLSRTTDQISPSYRIYENGRSDFKSSSRNRRSTDKKPKEKTWFQKLKDDYINPTTDVLGNNFSTILAVGTTIAAVAVMMHTSNESVHAVEEATKKNDDLLRHIEETIEDAVELPQIVKVEIGDDYEVIGSGHRTW